MKLLPTIFLIFFISGAGSSIAQEKNNSGDVSTKYYGAYYSYRYLGEDVTEMASKNANSFLNKKMKIDSLQFVLFSDTLKSPVYTFMHEERHHFFMRYTVDENLFKNLGDTVSVLTVTRNEDYRKKIIILSGNELVVNYKGYFYFFRKKNTK
ncbi:MAG TPA: hypothetical protein VMI12_06230 [Puia sp.]|nr:hypothetical protein [Puia sp.]